MTGSAQPSSTAKFDRRREQLTAAAATLINQHGVQGMTFAEVAALVSMNPNSVGYYFKKKEMLAHAAFLDTLHRMNAKVDEASGQPDPRARVRRYLGLVFGAQRRLRSGEDRPMTMLNDMASLPEPYAGDLIGRYRALLARMEGWFGDDADRSSRTSDTIRAHVLLESVLWLPAWLWSYSPAEFDRVRWRLFELFDQGIARPGAALSGPLTCLDLRTIDEDPARDAYLRAATRIINQRGYRGASIDRVSAELNVTKGSFYHRLATKDELVLACFRRSYDVVARVQDAGADADATSWTRICSAVATLVDFQFSENGPLLRTTALAALPREHRAGVIGRSNSQAQRFAGMAIDGVSEGSIRAVDPLVLSQLVMSMLNRAIELRGWAHELGREKAVAAFAAILAFGLFAAVP